MIFKAKVRRVGTSFMVTIPVGMIRQTNLKHGSICTVRITSKDNPHILSKAEITELANEITRKITTGGEREQIQRR